MSARSRLKAKGKIRQKTKIKAKLRGTKPTPGDAHPLLLGNPKGLANIKVRKANLKAKISVTEAMIGGTEKGSAMMTIGKPIGHGEIGEL